MSEFGGFGGRKTSWKKKKTDPYDAYGSDSPSGGGRRKRKRKPYDPNKAPKGPVDDQVLFDRAFRLLAARARSIGEIRDRLSRRKDAPPEGIERVIVRLIEKDYLHDERFALDYGSFKARYNRHGPGRIKQTLKTLKVPEEIIERVILQIFQEIPETNSIQELIAKRLRIKGSPTNWRDIQKLSDYLVRRGYSHDKVREEMSKVREEMKQTQLEAENDPDQEEILAQEKAQDEEMDFLLAKFIRIKGVPKNYKEARKISDRLLRRGYPHDLVRAKVDAVWRT